MRVQFTGDFAALQRFANKIRKVPSVLQVVNEQLCEETIELIREGFENSTDPFGNRWRDPKLRDGRPLEDTGGLKASWFRKFVGADRFSVANAKTYAIYHQRGTGVFGPAHARIYPTRARALRLPNGMFRRSVAGSPPRKMVPDTGAALPERWRKRYIATAQAVLTELFR